VNLRPATPADIPRLMEIERAAATAARWTETNYRRLFAGTGEGVQRLAWVLEDEGEIVGFLVASGVGTEWELENVVVAESARRRGLAARLLRHLLSVLPERDAGELRLEVRESNAAARALYAQAGFQECGRRADYYSSPQEDAVLYRLDFPQDSKKR